MAYDISSFKAKTVDIVTWLEKEFSGIRTGKATPALLDSVKVDSYGTKTALAHIAGITVEDARTLRIAPWDKGQIKDIEKALISSNLGVSVSVDDIGVRAGFPELTEERRVSLKRLAGERHEAARVSIKNERDKIWSEIQDQERDGELSEDEKFKGKDDLQKVVEETHKKLAELLKKKEEEING